MWRWMAGAGMAVMVSVAGAQERLPQAVAGTWRIVRVLPQTSAGACWTTAEAEALVGSTLEYSARSMRWKGGTVPLLGITTRQVTAEDVQQEAIDPAQARSALRLADLGIAGQRTMEVNLQHDDMDITGATTEVPGDSVLVAGPGRIVVSACGVYMEARRSVSRGTLTASTGAGAGQRKGL